MNVRVRDHFHCDGPTGKKKVLMVNAVTQFRKQEFRRSIPAKPESKQLSLALLEHFWQAAMASAASPEPFMEVQCKRYVYCYSM